MNGPAVEVDNKPRSQVEIHGLGLPQVYGGAPIRSKTIENFSSQEMQIDHLMTVIRTTNEAHTKEIAELTLNLKNTVEYNNALVKKLQGLREKIRSLLQLENF